MEHLCYEFEFLIQFSVDFVVFVVEANKTIVWFSEQHDPGAIFGQL